MSDVTHIDVYYDTDKNLWVIDREGEVIGEMHKRERAIEEAENVAIRNIPAEVSVLKDAGQTFGYHIEFDMKHDTEPHVAAK